MKQRNLFAQITQIIGAKGLLIVFSLLLSFMYCPNLQADTEDIVIKGKVVTEKNEPMIGATILVSKQNTGGVTDMEGNYTIHLNKAKFPLNLIVQYVGYKTEHITLSNCYDRDGKLIVLHEDRYSLNDVVVVGYGKSSRKKLTGAVAKVTSSVIQQASKEAPLLSLQGNAAGVYIHQGSGVPGGGSSSIVIRGITTLNRQNEPLYIIDGIPFNSISDNSVGYFRNGVFGNPDVLSLINPSDIESMEILKDADATAIYGTRGANGVVLITTKRGKGGKVKVSANYSLTTSYVAKFKDMLNIDEYIALRKKAVQRDLERGLISQDDYNATNYPDLLLWDQHKDYNWQEEMMGNTALAHDAQIQVSGGNNNTSFMVSGSYYKSNTVVVSDDDYTRWTARANINHHSNDNRFQIEAGVTFSGIDMLAKGSSAPNGSLTTAPNTPLYDEMGRPYYIPGDREYESKTYFMAYDGDSKTTNLIGNASVSYEVIKNLKAKVSLGYNYSANNQANKYGRYYENPYDESRFNEAMYASTNNHSFQVEPQLTYDIKLGKAKIAALLGGTYQTLNNQVMRMRGRNFPSDAFMDDITSAGSVIQYMNPKYQSKTASVFSRLNLDYDDKYLLSGIFRRDGSSRFGPGNRFGNFYSVGAAWLFGNEKFIKEGSIGKFLSHGKFRVSYGRTGNDGIGDYAYLTKYSTTQYPYEGQIGMYPSSIANENLHWETTDKMDLGLELGFFNDRILFNATWFQNYSTDLLTNEFIPSQTGFQAFPSNLDAEIKNWGWEFELNTQNIKTSNFTWKTNFNLTIPRNKLTKFKDLENSNYYRWYRIGESTNVVLGYNYLGVDKETGLPQFEDVDGDGRITSAGDYKALGNSDPKFYGGLTNTLTYKGFTLDFSFYFRKKPFSTGYGYYYYQPIGMQYNVTKEMAENYWTTPGQDAKYPGITTTTASNEYRYAYNYLRRSQYSYSNGSYLRLRDVTLSYNFPAKVLSKINMSNLRLYVQGKNLFTITNYDSYDPETSGNVPSLTSWVMGLNMTF